MTKIKNIFKSIYAFLNHLLICFNKLYESTWFIWSIIVVGIFFRIARWSQNFSLWLDEAMLSLNIVNRNLFELTKPLDYFQEAPVGFLFIEKFFTHLFGESELVLRFFPLLASVGALLLFYKVSKIVIDKKAVPAAMILFAISPELIYYSAIVKPYSGDVLASVVIFFVAAVLFKDKVSGRELILSLSAVLFIPYVSYTSIFVICGLIAGLFINVLVRRRKEDFLTLIYVGIIFVISIATFYFLIIRYKDDSSLEAYWARSFLSFPPRNFSELSYTADEICSVFKKPLSLRTYIFGKPIVNFLGIITLLGVTVAFCRKRYLYASIFVITLLALLTASGLKQYPFAPRLILFLIPFFILFLSEGLAFICSKLYMTPVFVLILFLLTRFQWDEAIHKTVHERPRQHIRPMIKYILENKKDGDKIYVYFRTKFAFMYYAERFDISEEDYYIGIDYAVSDETYMTDVDNLKGAAAVWVLMSHYENKPNYLYPFFEKLKKYGERQNQHYHQSRDARLYMYEINK